MNFISQYFQTWKADNIERDFNLKEVALTREEKIPPGRR